MLKKDDIFCARFVVVDPEQAQQFRKDLLDTMRDETKPYRGVLLRAVGIDDVFKERDDINDLLNEVAGYLSNNCLGDEEAEALLDKIEGNA